MSKCKDCVHIERDIYQARPIVHCARRRWDMVTSGRVIPRWYAEGTLYNNRLPIMAIGRTCPMFKPKA